MARIENEIIPVTRIEIAIVLLLQIQQVPPVNVELNINEFLLANLE